MTTRLARSALIVALASVLTAGECGGEVSACCTCLGYDEPRECEQADGTSCTYVPDECDEECGCD